MIMHLEAMRFLVEGLGYTVHIGDAPGDLTYPYVLLWGSGGDLRSDEMCGTQDDLNDLARVTMVAATAKDALLMPPIIRSVLIGARLGVPGRHVQPLRVADTQPVQADTQVTLPRLNRHPAFVVDLYRVISEPA